MKLAVPFIQQSKGSDDCGIVCLSMLLQFYAMPKCSSFNKAIEIYEGIGTYLPQIGSYLADLGFYTKIITANPHIFSNYHRYESIGNMIKYFADKQKDEINQDKKLGLGFFEKFLCSGGEIEVDIPTEKHIRTEIDEGRPLIALTSSQFLSAGSAGFNFHFHVIVGIDDRYIYVHDPLFSIGYKKYPITIYLYALYTSAYANVDNAAILQVRKDI